MAMSMLGRDLLQKMIVAKTDVAAYLSLRRAKGYMSVSESEHLRDSLFELCNVYRESAPRLQNEVAADEAAAFKQANAALSAAAIALMTGRHDCPHYIAIDADKLESCHDRLASSLSALLSVELAVES